MGVGVDVIEPTGFTWNDRKLARAGMDYADAVEVTRHVDWAAFEAQAAGRLVLLTTSGAVPLPDAVFRDDDILLLGSEGAGVPPTVHDRADLRVRVPMRPGFRSLNIGISAAIVLGEAMRQTGWMI
jgi:tRNA (cytidine/uridine-2'-O-)-methyltransferase